MSDSRTLLAEMFNGPGSSATRRPVEKEKLAEDVFNESLGLVGETDEFDQLSDEALDDVIRQLEGEASTNPEDELDKVASEKLAGEVMGHAILHENEMIKQALADGKCRFCKENPLNPAVHPTLCEACVPTS
jgi:hypothetical protein